jgi:hypothetical protein
MAKIINKTNFIDFYSILLFFIVVAILYRLRYKNIKWQKKGVC